MFTSPRGIFGFSSRSWIFRHSISPTSLDRRNLVFHHPVMSISLYSPDSRLLILINWICSHYLYDEYYIYMDIYNILIYNFLIDNIFIISLSRGYRFIWLLLIWRWVKDFNYRSPSPWTSVALDLLQSCFSAGPVLGLFYFIDFLGILGSDTWTA